MNACSRTQIVILSSQHACMHTCTSSHTHIYTHIKTHSHDPQVQLIHCVFLVVQMTYYYRNQMVPYTPSSTHQEPTTRSVLLSQTLCFIVLHKEVIKTEKQLFTPDQITSPLPPSVKYEIKVLYMYTYSIYVVYTHHTHTYTHTFL